MVDCLVKLPKLSLSLNPGYVRVQNAIPYFCCEYEFGKVFSDETAELFSQLGIHQYIRGVQLFRSLGQEDRNIHIDGTNPEINEGVINWVPNDPLDSDWSTDFFDVPMSKGIRSQQNKNLGSKITFDPTDCKLAVSWTGPTREPVLMRVNIPHRIQNRRDQERWCYSIRFMPRKLSYFDLKNVLTNFQ
jgi:hypothetical protein